MQPSNRALGVGEVAALVVTALLVGALASLALRPPGAVVESVADDGGRALASIRWKVPVAFGTHLPVAGDGVPPIAESVARASGGRIVLELFEPGELVPSLGIVEAVAAGKVPAGYAWLGYDQGTIPSSPLFAAVPFGMEPVEYAAWWYEGDGRRLAEEVYAEHRIHPLLCGLIGPETAGWFREEIATIEQLAGLKIRFAGLGGRVLQRLGASVTVLPAGEIFPALEKGAIDATEFSMPVVDEKLGFDRVAKHNYFPGWHQTFTALHLVVNAEIWAGIDDPARAILESACTAGVIRNLARGEALQGPVIASYPDKGVTARRLPDDVLRRLEVATREVLAEEAARDARFAEVEASQRAFSDSYRPWKRLGYLPRDW